MQQQPIRIQSIDLLRGLVMILMALDHVRDYFHADAFVHDPLDLQTTSAGLFFTRWITHFCAPIFVFLAGISAYLSGMNKEKKVMARFLIVRGLWLIFIEFAVVSFGWTFDPFYHVLVMQVIWAIGVSMIVLGLFIRLPYRVILGMGLLIICTHNLLDYPEAELQGHVGFWWDLLHHGSFALYPFAPGHGVLVVYPFLPWIGVILLGYCAGKIYETADTGARRRILLRSGIGLIALFVVLRIFNLYGDPSPWFRQEHAGLSFLSFLNVTKYPPSLLFFCMTIGPALIFLALAEFRIGSLANKVKVFGQVPFFYYIVHLYFIHLLVIPCFFLSGYGREEIVSGTPFLFRPGTFGFGLGTVYLIWALLVITLYPVCLWYGQYKRSHTSSWLKYL